MSHVRYRRPLSRVFAWPLAFALATLTGLVCGLTGDGAGDMAAWVLVGLAPLCIIALLMRRDPTSSPSQH